jgi:hypothetical protein
MMLWNRRRGLGLLLLMCRDSHLWMYVSSLIESGECEYVRTALLVKPVFSVNMLEMNTGEGRKGNAYIAMTFAGHRLWVS